jgi:hypothetical protein
MKGVGMTIMRRALATFVIAALISLPTGSSALAATAIEYGLIT